MIDRRIGWTLLAVTALALSVGACKDPDPVPVERCDEVVRHTKGILKGGAPPDAEMMATCKKGTDKQRGCILASNSVATMLKCAR